MGEITMHQLIKKTIYQIIDRQSNPCRVKEEDIRAQSLSEVITDNHLRTLYCQNFKTTVSRDSKEMIMKG